MAALKKFLSCSEMLPCEFMKMETQRTFPRNVPTFSGQVVSRNTSEQLIGKHL